MQYFIGFGLQIFHSGLGRLREEVNNKHLS